MGEKIYKKVGSRYKEIGETFEGFPADGVWLVTNGKRNRECIAHLSDLPNIPVLATSFRLSMKNEVLKTINRKLDEKDHYVSLNDIAIIACDAVAEILERNKGGI